MLRKAILIARLPIEALFGLLYMSGLLLLPAIFKGYVASILVGYLGMPTRERGLPPDQATLHHLEYWCMLAGLLFVCFLVANGLLWFKDAYSIIQKLRRREA